MRVGLISYASSINRFDVAQKHLNKAAQWLASKEIKCVFDNKIILDEEMNQESIKNLKKYTPDIIIIQIGTFTKGEMLVKLIVEFKDTPFFVWGLNDPILKDHPTIPLNSLTGMTMLTSYLCRFEKKFNYAYSCSFNEIVKNKIDLMIRVIRVKKELKDSKYAIVGSRAPGFYLSMVDELNFRKMIGPEIVYLSLASLFDMSNKINIKRVNEEIKKISSNTIINISNEMLEKNVRMQLALHDYASLNNISGITLKCWPELQDIYGCAGCGTLSNLVDMGITTSCEGDVAGLATVDILKKLTGKDSFFADLVAVTENGYIKAWHCGIGPKSLASGQITYQEQSTMRNGIGVGVQYDMKKGKVALCKLSELGQNYRFLIAKGNIEDKDREVLGVQADIALDAGSDQFLRTVIENGFEHHFALVHADITNDIEELSKYMNFSVVQV